MVAWNRHDYGVAQTEVRKLRRRVRQDVQRAMAAPQAMQVNHMGGINVARNAPGRRSRAELHWQAIVHMTMVVMADAPSRWDAAAGWCSSIDRVFIELPCSAWSCYRARYLAGKRGAVWAGKRAAGAGRLHLDPKSRPVLQEIAASPEAMAHLADLVAGAGLDVVFSGRPAERLADHKDLVREATRFAQGDILAGGAPTEAARGAIGGRVVMRRELRLKVCTSIARRTGIHPLRGRGGAVHRAGAVRKRPRGGLEVQTERRIAQAGSGRRQGARAAEKRGREAHPCCCQTHPGDVEVARLRFSAVRREATGIEDERTAQDPRQLFAAEAAPCMPVYQAPEESRPCIEEWPRRWSRQWRMRTVRMLDVRAMQRDFQNAPRTSPGPDGIQYRLRQAEAHSAAQPLKEVLQALRHLG